MDKAKRKYFENSFCCFRFQVLLSVLSAPFYYVSDMLVSNLADSEQLFPLANVAANLLAYRLADHCMYQLYNAHMFIVSTIKWTSVGTSYIHSHTYSRPMSKVGKSNVPIEL